VSRSIHTTQRDVREAWRVRCAHRSDFAAERARLRRELAKKEHIKGQVLDERRAGPSPAGAPIETIPIEVHDADASVHFPASTDDVRAILRLLPPGTTDGLGAIDLRLGREVQEEQTDEPEDCERDPLIGRSGSEVLPGYWSPPVLGRYRFPAAAIEIYAYVYAPDAPLREPIELYLRLRQLETLVHEVGHHHDYTARIARGRWRADDDAKVEAYAEARQHAWTVAVVVPYLERTYPAQVAALGALVEEHGGLALPLAALLDDPTGRGRPFSIAGALSRLLDDVARGDPAARVQVSFARELHYLERYVEARQVLAVVQGRDPGCLPARLLEADIDVHEGAHERAAALCRAILTDDPSCVDAWDVLADALGGQQEWPGVIAAASAALALEMVAWERTSMIRRRARALLEVSDLAALDADLAALEEGGPMGRRAVPPLRARRSLKLGHFDETLALARSALPEAGGLARAELAAAGFEAACLLGRSDEAPALPRASRGLLRRQGHAAWMDRIEAAWGDRLNDGSRVTVRGRLRSQGA